MKNFSLIAAILLPIAAFAQKPKPLPKTFDVLVGTYTSGTSKGISVFRFYAETGRLAYLSQIDGVSNPSYLAVSADNKFVYAVNENDQGEVSSFNFDAKMGTLKFINKQSTLGGSPCYVSVDKANKSLFVANYSGGNIAVLPLNEDGSIGQAVQTIGDSGPFGPNKERQEKAHVHTAVLSPDEKYVFYTDLGTDKLHITRYKPGKDSPLRGVKPPFVSVAPGGGPRHLDFSADKKHLYLVQEMGSAVTMYDYDNGKLTEKQTVTLLKDGFTGATGAADIHVSPNGLFLYASNRGDANDISVFSINQETGELTFVDRRSTNGKAPRNFVIDPTGTFLIVANQNTDAVYVYRLDKTTGKMLGIVYKIDIGNPVCLKFAPAQ
ncbi:lactonase family protein [Mucilaginibacter sp. ZT4R22]|uniref:Lactonase family protein n=1 Tax=Mucilaginibacter pankratovii TaxID=2772110 RepID=A0ABR7WTG3_9SPHI|nr:lactonase family protein [Mucilaginibacter pankratovii]MBD1365478.1 lactonase family protein [Mucilaginibacter pankratovii]